VDRVLPGGPDGLEADGQQRDYQCYSSTKNLSDTDLACPLLSHIGCQSEQTQARDQDGEAGKNTGKHSGQYFLAEPGVELLVGGMAGNDYQLFATSCRLQRVRL
jgi:hypothetical protein